MESSQTPSQPQQQQHPPFRFQLHLNPLPSSSLPAHTSLDSAAAGLKSSDLSSPPPPPPQGQQQPPPRPSLSEFLHSIITTSYEFARHTVPNAFETRHGGRNQSSSPSAAGVQVLSRVAEFDARGDSDDPHHDREHEHERDDGREEVGEIGERGKKKGKGARQGKKKSKGKNNNKKRAKEYWYARQSVHDDEPVHGSASWAEFVGGLRDDHVVNEMDYTPSVSSADEILDWHVRGDEVEGWKILKVCGRFFFSSPFYF